MSKERDLDIIDLMALLWRARWYVLLFSTLGILAAVALHIRLKPISHTYSTPVRILKALDGNLDLSISKINAALSNRDNLDLFYQIFSTQTQENLGSFRLDKDQFLMRQSGVLGPRLIVVQLRYLGGVVYIDCRMTSADTTQHIPAALVKAATKLMEELNVAAMANATDAFALLESFNLLSLTKIHVQKEKALAVPRLAVARMTEELVALGTKQVYNQADIFDTFLSTLAKAQAEKKVSETQAKELLQRFIEAKASYWAADAKFEGVINDANSSASEENRKGFREGIDSQNLSPTFQVAGGEASIRFEEKGERRYAVYVIAGAFLGGLVGLTLFALMLFFSTNIHRIRGIIKS